VRVSGISPFLPRCRCRVTKGEAAPTYCWQMTPCLKAEAASLAVILGGQRGDLEAAQADYERWSADTAEDRESAGQAQAELERRHAHEIEEPEATICTPEPEIPEMEPESEPQASPEADVHEPEAADA